MFNQEFCDFLEYHITGTLCNSEDIEKRRCWCDGIFMPDTEKELSIELIKITKEIKTRAWIDEGRIKGKERGQFIYDLIICLGDKSVQQIINGHDLKECVPNKQSDDWILLDRENRKMEIRLM